MRVINEPIYSTLTFLKRLLYQWILRRTCEDCGWYMPRFDACWAMEDTKFCINFCDYKNYKKQLERQKDNK